MKKKIIAFCVIALLATILFFPVTTTSVISGDGKVLALNKEELRDCTLSIEIKEVNSLAYRYSKTFSFVLDGTSISDFFGDVHTDAVEDFCTITQFYYDANKNKIVHYGLLYGEDLSYAFIISNGELYFVNPGEHMSISEIPFSWHLD